MAKRTVNVSKAVIDESLERDSSHCMIAEAIRRTFPKVRRVSVDLQTIRFSDYAARKRYVYLTPRAAQMALVQFDQGSKPMPFAFRLSQPTIVEMTERTPEIKAREQKYNKEHPRESVNRAKPKKKGKLVRRRKDRTDVERIEGGKTPPTIPGGARRAFGMRAFAF